MKSENIKSGYELLRDPRLNKGTAFTEKERDKYGLRGLLPDVVETIDTQIDRIHEQVGLFKQPIDKYIYLSQMHDNNETLFFRTIMDDPAEYLPLVYTPTVGEACQKFGHILRRSRGFYISINDKNNIRQILKNWPEKDIRFTVVTDGGRILGLGDLGVCGIGIPIGKLVLYTACAGVDPHYTLPIVLDAGTNNTEFLEDPLYPGMKINRIRGKEFDDFIEEFVTAINDVFPEICIQWEDFEGPDAISILAKYKERVCTFNDDIQGTAAVAAAGLLGACKFTGKPITEQRFLFLGAGSAATGIASLLSKILQQNRLSENESLEHLWMFDINGLLVKSRSDIADYQLPFTHDFEHITNFADAVKKVKPSAIIGVSTIGGAFTKDVIEAMTEINERPIIFPYSNPTLHSECTAEEAYQFSGGKSIFASGSPFPPVEVNGKKFTPSQGNNVYIFPAMGMAILATEAKRVTDEMFIRAAESLASQVTNEMLDNGIIYPPISDILDVSIKIAVDIAAFIFENGFAGVAAPDNVAEYIKSKVYYPKYR